jgi:hypothetical protein
VQASPNGTIQPTTNLVKAMHVLRLMTGKWAAALLT